MNTCIKRGARRLDKHRLQRFPFLREIFENLDGYCFSDNVSHILMAWYAFLVALCAVCFACMSRATSDLVSPARYGTRRNRGSPLEILPRLSSAIANKDFKRLTNDCYRPRKGKTQCQCNFVIVNCWSCFAIYTVFKASAVLHAHLWKFTKLRMLFMTS